MPQPEHRWGTGFRLDEGKTPKMPHAAERQSRQSSAHSVGKPYPKSILS